MTTPESKPPSTIDSVHSPNLNEKTELQDDAPSVPGDEEMEYPSSGKLALISLGLALATFVVALDNTIIATAIPTITTVFDSLNDVGWYGSSYLLTMTSLQPSFGKIYANFDMKITYLTALLIFEVGSVICAAATSSPMLIVGRAIAGVGASAIFSGGMNIIGYSVPIEKRAMYVAALSSMFGLASVVGPLLGGAFTDKVSWRWCFWINLPFGAIAFSSVFFFFKSPKRKTSTLTFKEKIAQIDLLGALFLISGVTCLILALQWGGTVYPWNSSRVYGLFIGFGLIIAVFIVIQFKRGENATIPPAIFKQRTVLVSALYTALFSMGMFVAIYYLPFYFQAIKNTSAVGSGIRTIPYLVSITISSVIVGGLITVTGHYAPFLWIGSAIFTVGCAMISTLDVDSSTGMWFGYQVLAGAGGGASVQIPFLAVQVALKQADMPVGVAIVMFFNSLGGAIAIAIAQNIFSNQLIENVPKYAPNVNPGVVIAAGATHLREIVPADSLAGVLEAYAKALRTTFIPPIAFAGLAFIIGLGIERINVKGRKLAAVAA
ncbi:major facilitator superfamily domain-containing protein [Mucidula mucida]|nr:major facilitator superfamily domain-containing protein [Mucidula mucida]